MAEYIKREDVINNVKKIPGLSFGANGPYDSKPMEGLVDPWWILGEVRDLPAADVRENVRGKNVADEYAGCDQFICSNCGIELRGWYSVERDDDGDLVGFDYVFKFCPECGADMRGDADGTE